MTLVQRALATLALAIVPFGATAQCGHDRTTDQAMSCAEGFVLDLETGLCEPIATG